MTSIGEPSLVVQRRENQVQVTYYLDNEKITEGHAKIIRKEGRSYELDLAQAISYAAHIVYKNIEQMELAKEAAI